MSITERIRYGAAELKSSYNHHLALALVISVALHALAIGLFVMSADPAIALPDSDVRRDTTIVIPPGGLKFGDRILDPLPDPARGPKAPTRAGAPTQSPTTFGKPVVVDSDATVVDKPVATVDQIPNVAGTSGVFADSGKGGSAGDGGSGGNGVGRDPGAANGTVPPTLDATIDFDPTVTLPDLDMGELLARIEYPRAARVNGIEGEVAVKALVGVDGLIERVEVLESTNRIFEQAALDAVRGSRGTPGRQSDVPVAVWIRIPIRFQLR